MKTWLFFGASLTMLWLMTALFAGSMRIETSRTERVAVSSSTSAVLTSETASTVGAAILGEVTTTTSSPVSMPEPKPTQPTPERTNPEPKPAVEVPQQPVVESPKPTPAPTPAPRKLKWGVFTGSNPSSIADFESRIDVNPDYLAYFVHWANGDGKLPTWLHGVAADKGRTLIIFWEASDFTIGGTEQPAFAYRTILRGDHDAYIADFARQTKEYGDHIILIPFSEWNGNWTPWSGTKNGNTPQEAVEAYRYIHGFFDDVPNVSFGIAFNAASVPSTPENQIERYYPGDTYVDYIGLDGFNMGYGTYGWETFDEIFAPGLRKLAQYGKPTLLFSFASAEGPHSKADWLNDALNVQLPKYPHVIGFVYFNQNKERNWLLWSDDETWEVFKNYVE